MIGFFLDRMGFGPKSDPKKVEEAKRVAEEARRAANHETAEQMLSAILAAAAKAQAEASQMTGGASLQQAITAAEARHRELCAELEKYIKDKDITDIVVPDDKIEWGITWEQMSAHDKWLRQSCHSLLLQQKYSTENWGKQDDEGKRGILNSLLGDVTNILGLSGIVKNEIAFIPIPMEGDYQTSGQYDPRPGVRRVQINLRVLHGESSYDLLRVIIHEVRHAYQHGLVDGTFPIVTAKTKKNLKDNFANPQGANGGENFGAYSSQIKEYDARMFAGDEGRESEYPPTHRGSWGTKNEE